MQLVETWHRQVYLLPPEKTDKCQPINQGEGFEMGVELDKHLETEDDLEKDQSSMRKRNDSSFNSMAW